MMIGLLAVPRRLTDSYWEAGGGCNRASATMWACPGPGVCLMFEVNSDRKASWRYWQADQGYDKWQRADTSGLCSMRRRNL